MNMMYLNLSSLLLGMWLVSCNPSTNLPSETITSPPPVETITSPASPATLSQDLPITAKTILNGQTIEIEVARTPQQQTIGLMNRRVLPPNRGMLFPFNPPQAVSFWMKNTLIPLDIIFLRDGKVKSIATQVPPCEKDPCPSYGPDNASELIDSVLELPAGRAQELGLKTGSAIEIQFLPTSR